MPSSRKSPIAQLYCGSTLEQKTILPPVITHGAQERIEGMLVDFPKYIPEGNVGVGGSCLSDAPEKGTFVTPAIVKDVPADSALATTEIFGPVLAVTAFENEEETVVLANSTHADGTKSLR